jgi:hypothetical protein
LITRIALILVAFATVSGLILLADIQLLIQVFTALPPLSLAMLVAVFLVGAVLKGLRWAFYLRSARLDIRWRDGATSYLAGMTTSALPGGSWLAPRLAQEHGMVRMRQAAPALFVSYIVDALTLPLVILALLIITDQSSYSFAIPIAGLAIGLVLFAMGRSSRVWKLVASVLARSRITQRWLPKERDVQERVQALMRPRVLMGGIAFSLVATGLSAAFLMVLVVALTFRGLAPGEALWIHSVSEAARVALPVPGGIGVTDSSITGMLTQHGIGLRRATFLALVLRSSEAGFRVLFGTLVLFVRYESFLLNALDLRRRTRGACRRASRMPGIKWTLTPLVEAIRLRLAGPISAVIDPTVAEEAPSAD